MSATRAEQPLAELFTAYSGAALEGAATVQRVEVRRAYFAGAFALRQLLIDANAHPPEVLQQVRALVDSELAVWQSTLGTCLEGKV